MVSPTRWGWCVSVILREPDELNIHNDVVEQSSTVQYLSVQPSIF